MDPLPPALLTLHKGFKLVRVIYRDVDRFASDRVSEPEFHRGKEEPLPPVHITLYTIEQVTGNRVPASGHVPP